MHAPAEHLQIKLRVAAWSPLVLLLSTGWAPESQADATRAWFHRSPVGMEAGPTGAQPGYGGTHDAHCCAEFNGRGVCRGRVH